MDVYERWPEQIEAVTDESGALIYFGRWEPGEALEPGNVGYIREDLATDRGAVSAEGAITVLSNALDLSEDFPDDEQGRGDALMALQFAVRQAINHLRGPYD